jgi:hypothetical protein
VDSIKEWFSNRKIAKRLSEEFNEG